MLYQTHIKTQELQSLFLSPTEVVQEGLFSDGSLGHVTWLRAVLYPRSCTTQQQMLSGMFLPSPYAQFRCKAPCYSRPFHFVIYGRALESSSFSLLLPQVYFSAYAETKAPYLLHLGCLWQGHTHSCFCNSQREAKEMQVSRTPLLSNPFDCWSKRQELEQLSFGWLPVWVTILTGV